MKLNLQEIDAKGLIESLPGMVFYLDKDFRLLAFNAASLGFFKLIGCPMPKTGLYLPDFYPEDNRRSLIDKLNKSVKGRAFVFEEDFYINAFKHSFDITIYSFPNRNGTLHGYCIRLRNISDQKSSFRAMIEAKENYRRIFQFNPLSMYLVDLNTYQILEVNEKAIMEFAYSKDEFLDLKIFDISHEEEHDRVIDFFQKIKNGENADPPGIWRHRDKKGKEIFMEMTYHKMLYSRKDVVVSIAKNITEKLRMEHQLEEERRMRQRQITEAVLDAQETERSEIGRELHDNVNQLLGTIPLYVNMARSHPDRRDEFLNISVDHALQAIEEIRKLSKRLVTPFLQDDSLLEAVEHLVNEIMALHPVKIELSLSEFDENTTSGKFKLNIFRIIQEQLNNILKHANAKTIRISLLGNNNKTKLEITDDGKGFDTTKQSNGVGVFNIKSRAGLYKGKVGLISAPGRGCKLRVVFSKAV